MLQALLSAQKTMLFRDDNESIAMVSVVRWEGC